MDESPILVMEGGAMRGLFTAGVLDAFMDHHFYFPKVVGISAGTCRGWDICPGSAAAVCG